jgi:chromosome segregation ATPase
VRKMESNPLRSLKASLEKAQKNTHNMLTRIHRFDERLAAIDEEMKPIQVTTAKYTKAKDNIGLTLAEVEKTYEYFRVAQQVTEVINAGVNLQNPAKQKEFVDAFGRLSEAKRFFEQHRRDIKSAGSALDQIEELLKVCCDHEWQCFTRDILYFGCACRLHRRLVSKSLTSYSCPAGSL